MRPDEILAQEKLADIFVYSGTLNRGGATQLIKICDGIQERRPNVALILCTYGGDPDAAYIIARYLRRTYKAFSLYVFGHCKSAGTLIALGATEIVMSNRGEFGPIDIQIIKPDDIFRRSSGLDISQALDYLNKYAYQIFKSQFYQLIIGSNGTISTKTAADIAATITVGLLSPITSQIEPLKAGEMARANNLVLEYGQKLGANRDTITALTSNYSSHTFVIDHEEASEILGNVRTPNDSELKLERYLQALLLAQTGQDALYEPNAEVTVIHVNPSLEPDNTVEEGDISNASTNGAVQSQTITDSAQRRVVDGECASERVIST